MSNPLNNNNNNAPFRVRFNPVVSQLSYKYGPWNDENDHDNMASSQVQGDKNRNQNFVRNGTSGSQQPSLILMCQNPVEKVLVTINNNSGTGNNIITSISKPATVGVVHAHPPPPKLAKQYPDLLATTPSLYKRKESREESASFSAIPGNSNNQRNELTFGEAQASDFLLANSDLNLNEKGPNSLSHTTTPTDEGRKIRSKLSWTSGLVQQLALFKKIVNIKNINKTKPNYNNSLLEVDDKLQPQPGREMEQDKIAKKRGRGRRRQQRSVVVSGLSSSQENNKKSGSESPSSTKLTLNEFGNGDKPFVDKNNYSLERGLSISKDNKITGFENDVLQVEQDTLITENSSPIRPLTTPFQQHLNKKSKPSVQDTFSYKRCLDPDESELKDELSLNFERILEEIESLEESNPSLQRGEGGFYSDISFENSMNRNEDEINALVNECCAVSAALGNLTASVNTTQHTPTPRKVEEKQEPKLEKRPPLPPTHKINNNNNNNNKYLNTVLKSQFFQTNTAAKIHHPPNKRSKPLKGDSKIIRSLDAKLLEFKEGIHRSREELYRIHPNCEEIDRSVRSFMEIDRFGRNPPNRTGSTGWESSTSSLFSEECSTPNTFPPNNNDHSPQYDEEGLNKEWDSIVAKTKGKLLVSSLFNQPCKDEGKIIQANNSTGILETDLDTGTSREVFFKDDNQSYCSNNHHTPEVVKTPNNLKSTSKLQVQRNTCSMQNLNLEPSSSSSTLSPAVPKEDRSRSMEFLLDEEKQSQLMPPENTLKKNQERQVSEHELRIQRSLQRLNVPDWYKSYATTPNSTPSGKTPDKQFGSSSGLAGGWSGLSSSKTSSLTSLHSAGRYPGSKTQFSSTRYKGTASTGGRSSRESLMSPSSTASHSPSPYFERSSFTYGMPYALTRFASSRMSCGASPASISPSPSPVGGITSSTSTPVSSGPMSTRYGYNKTPYLGWRSQERLTSKTLYRSPSERLAADLLAQKQQKAPTTPVSTTGSEISIVTSPRKETSSDLSLNISDTSESSNKLNRVRSSIKEVSNAIVDYVNESKPLDESINGRASPRRGLIWLESSFVGTKPIGSPGTPDTPSVIMSKHLGAQSSAYLNSKRSSMKLDHNGDQNNSSFGAAGGKGSEVCQNSAYTRNVNWRDK